MCGFAMRCPELKKSPLLPQQCWAVGRAYTHIPKADGCTALQPNSQVQAWEAPSEGSKGLTNGVSMRYSSQWGKKNGLPLDWSWIQEHSMSWLAYKGSEETTLSLVVWWRLPERAGLGASWTKRVGRNFKQQASVTQEAWSHRRPPSWWRAQAPPFSLPAAPVGPVTGISAFSTFPRDLEPGRLLGTRGQELLVCAQEHPCSGKQSTLEPSSQ